MTTILGSIAINQLTDITDTTKALAVNFASAGTGAVSTLSVPNAGQTFTLPNATVTLVGENSTQTITNKTINASLNTITNITNSSIDAAAAISGSKISGNITGNAANVTGTVLIANGGTGATTAATARTNLLAAQSGANADITSLSQTTVIALKGGTNAVSLQPDPATTVWTMQLPAGAGSSGQFLRTNGAGVLTWAAASGGGSFPSMGNIAIVDQINGNNSTATVGGLPFLTITAALAAVTSGQHVFILPGTYSESITIPSNIAVRGFSERTVIIQRSAVTANTTVVTMGDNTQIENVTISLTSATAGLTLKGIEFPNTTVTSAKVRNIIISISNTSTGAGTIYGIHFSGTGNNPVQYDCVRLGTIDISAAVSTKAVGVYSDAANVNSISYLYIAIVRNSGTGIYYGIETDNISTQMNCFNSLIYSTSANVAQTNGAIYLRNTALTSNSALSSGFFDANPVKFMIFSCIGATGSWTGTNGRFLRLGSGALSTTEIRYPIPTGFILRKISLRRANTTNSVTLTVRINGVDTALTRTIAAGNASAELTGNIGLNGAPPALISVAISQTVNGAATNPSITIEYY